MGGRGGGAPGGGGGVGWRGVGVGGRGGGDRARGGRVGGRGGGRDWDVQSPGCRLLPGVIEDDVHHLPHAKVGLPPLIQPHNCRLLLPAPPSFPPPVLPLPPPPVGLLLQGLHLLPGRVWPCGDHWPLTVGHCLLLEPVPGEPGVGGAGGSLVVPVEGGGRPALLRAGQGGSHLWESGEERGAVVWLAGPGTGSGGARPGVAPPGPGTVAHFGDAVLAGDQLPAATVLWGRGGGGVRLQEPGRRVESMNILPGLGAH